MPRTRLALRVLLASIAVSCLFAILGVAGGDSDHTAGKLFGSALAIGCASLLAMAAFYAWSHPYARAIARVCLATTGLALVGVMYAIWVHTSGDLAFDIIASAATLALASAHATILAQTRLAPSFQWARPATFACDAMLVGAVLAAVWHTGHHDEALFQGIAILSIVAVGMTLTTIVLHAMSRHEPVPVTGERAAVFYCPGCGKRLWAPAGDVRCWHCTKVFAVHPVDDAVEPAHAIAAIR
jgi:predicted RNA-binding Zn-ribbon protein involved in translation (DUF1610 family)|nr:hypothetical protein [Kofleriaceae bacterium]